MKRCYVDIAEGQVHYQTEGNGEPLILLHQIPLNSNEYSRLIPSLSGEYQCITIDTPAYGESDPLSKSQPRIKDYANTIFDFTVALGITKANLYGTHTGAAIAAEVTASHPNLIDKLILCGCPNYTPEQRKGRLEAFQKREFSAVDDVFVTKVWNTPFRVPPSAEARHLYFTSYLRWYWSFGHKVWDGHLAAIWFEPEKRLPLIKCPVLLLNAEKGPFIEHLEVTKSYIPRCRTKVIEGASAYVALEQPDVLAEIVLDFLRMPRV